MIKSRKLNVFLFTTLAAISVHAAEPEAVPGEFIVKLRPQISMMSLDFLSARLGAKIKSKILDDENFYVIQKPMIEMKSAVIKEISQDPMVEYVEPNFIYRASALPNDPDFSKLWGLKNSGQKDSANQVGKAGIDIGAEEAWNITTGSKDVVVAVIDTGINYTHQDLKNNVWTNEAEAKGKPGVDDDKNGYVDDIHGYDFANNDGDPKDDQGHGSHCSGTIGGRGDDGVGLAGVNWNVRIMGVKFLDNQGSGTLEAAIKSIDYATKAGAKIMSNSWGGGGYSKALEESIQRADQAGALFIAAAGNESNNNDVKSSYPASYKIDNIISVAAIDNQGNTASFTNYGAKTVHLAAPGVNIYSSLNTDKGYDSWSGTSMATPHVSGVAALLAAHEPNLTALEIKERLLNTVVPLASLKKKTITGGMVNAYYALTNQKAPADPNDPELWNKVDLQISSAHPYGKNENKIFEAHVEGASEFSLYFENFDLEKGYDFVKIYDANGAVVQTLTGKQPGTWSSVIKGDYAKIVLTSDNSLELTGFDITKAALR